MPQVIEISVCGIDIKVPGAPSTVEEFNAQAAAAGDTSANPVLDEALSNITYRGYSPLVRKALSAKLVENGFARLIKGKGKQRKDGTTPDILENEGAHVARALAEEVISEADLTAIGQAFADITPFSEGMKSQRSAGTGVDKKLLADADKVIARVAAGELTWAKFESNVARLVDEFALDTDDSGTPSRETVARALKAAADAAKAMAAGV